MNNRPYERTTEWYKDAIIYQIHVRSFYDSNGDGIGDFKGLIQKLDYIEFLGVNTIWLLPFYPSPLKDEGYDIADYYNINPIYGTLTDFKALLNAAHAKQINVITELVINHTSNEHPWFKKSRQAPAGSFWRNYYTWSDTTDKYTDARIIFRDFEPSNWTWDATANAYYWHRFYAHQPDLNYDNPVVQQEIFKIVDFWLTLGVDGLRLDAIPYLFQKDNTNCENLPETHAFLKKLNHYINARYSNRFLLAEANQWPDEAVSYFGVGDECQMAFHFPLMPRLYMAMHLENSAPIIDIINQTPAIPANCQWAIFLRNHDELTLEMVTDEEREYMYRTYGYAQQMKINLGIRRRLAPLMSGDRRKIELINALLCSMPGSPVLYYGDEIGMGDNIYLNDRNSVRTPMQWSSDRNAGFSEAIAQQLFLPVITEPEYNYQTVNVEFQLKNNQSLLRWMKRLIEVRGAYPTFGRGSLDFVPSTNTKIISFYRRYEKETVLVLINLSRHNQYCNLDLSAFANYSLFELFGKNYFPTITTSPYVFTLAPYSFLWFDIKAPLLPISATNLAVITNVETTWSILLQPRYQKKLENAFITYLPTCHWFTAKSLTILNVRLKDHLVITDAIYLIFLDVEFQTTDVEQYVLFITTADTLEKIDVPICRIQNNNGDSDYFVDAMSKPTSRMVLLHRFCSKRTYLGNNSSLTIQTTRLAKTIVSSTPVNQEVTVLNDYANLSIISNQLASLKLYRRCEVGENPNVEITQLLNPSNGLVLPKLAAIMRYNLQNKVMTIGVVEQLIKHQENAWQYIVTMLLTLIKQAPNTDKNHWVLTYPWHQRYQDIPIDLANVFGHHTHLIFLLAKRTAQMHLALAGDMTNPSFLAEPFTFFDQRNLYQSIRNNVLHTIKLIKNAPIKTIDDIAINIAQRLTEQVLLVIKPLLTDTLAAKKIRCHGDYHLRHLLYTGTDFIIAHYEGNLNLHLSERKIKRSPLKDIATLLRSFHYTIYSIVIDNNTRLPKSFNPEWWYGGICQLFIHAYLNYPGINRLMPIDAAGFSLLLKAYMLENICCEINDEFNNRPQWMTVPYNGLIHLF